MKTRKQILEEIIRLKKCIVTREEYIKSNYVDTESKTMYKKEIKEIENDIQRLHWVLEN